jgi:hypothetical protein
LSEPEVADETPTPEPVASAHKSIFGKKNVDAASNISSGDSDRKEPVAESTVVPITPSPTAAQPFADDDDETETETEAEVEVEVEVEQEPT